MCLSRLMSSPNSTEPTIAYKEFRIVDGEIHNAFRRTRNPWKIGRERSVNPRSKKISNRWKRLSYPAGFHAYAYKRAPGYGKVLAKVQLRDIHTIGKQGGRLAYVARYCKILEIFGQ